MSTTADAWSISIKAIGGAVKKNSPGADTNDVEKNFTVTVSPEDDLTSLYDQIEGITGLKASQQRLIYRGRLIGGLGGQEKTEKLDVTEQEPKIKDIAGLGDGQTIHLVRRKESRETTDAETEGGSTDNTTPSPSSSSERDGDSLSGNGTASLLAALIGLGGLEGGESSEPATATPTATAGQRQRVGWRSSRLGRNRRPHYRLTHEDLEIPDPGTMEPVRQGLMTLHTLLPHARVNTHEENPSPLESNRRWYVGQWIDCRDTVNQWLEATIVEIVRPDDILPPRSEEVGSSEILRITEPATDPAVSANDLDGRRQLLLEPCEEGDVYDEGGQLAGYKRRASNKHVQLLLIHYNGWPHRWDEWIRSDSERIRPFRTRTRHPTMSTHASPTTQSAFNESPSTVIRDDDITVERTALLPELHRVVTAVNDLIVSATTDQRSNSSPIQNSENLDTPWDPCKSPEAGDDDDLEDLPPLSGGTEQCSQQSSSSYRSVQSRRQLELLGPVLDRLGRVLIDAAPHVATMATSLPRTTENGVTAESSGPPDPADDNPSTLGGLLSLLGRDRRRQSSNGVANEAGPASVETQEQPSQIDPDYMDFATGVVNTSRGEVRTGPRSRGQSDDVAGLLGAYLAAASLGSLSSGEGADSGEENGNNMMGLGRLLRERGTTVGGGAGIDIHIHAVVTAPGVAPGGGLGFATLGVPPVANAATRSALSPGRERRGSGSILRLRTPSVAEDEDDGLFSELYSENPTPVNPNSSQDSDSDNATGDDEAVRSEYSAQSDGEFLSRLTSSRQGSGVSLSRTDSFSVSPSRSSSDGSSRRSSSSASPRRNSVLGRFFRRSRRSGS